jgi:hypothetical protein
MKSGKQRLKRKKVRKQRRVNLNNSPTAKLRRELMIRGKLRNDRFS